MARSSDARVHALMAVVAQNIRRFRESAAMTQEEAARAMGGKVGANAVARWERGDTWIGAAELKLLMDVYKRPVDHAFLDSPPWTTTVRAARHL